MHETSSSFDRTPQKVKVPMMSGSLGDATVRELLVELGRLEESLVLRDDGDAAGDERLITRREDAILAELRRRRDGSPPHAWSGDSSR